ncbi:hypothetical protein HS961_00060 [Comamonas piscis]|uniref:Uncharacterized protein n=2 Tax=Comamonas piscis TaxID=1562974 RepID=A0A7G5ENH2_9BURK|nr:hypothetical protein HS961_00060 [Comamonas piscis]
MSHRENAMQTAALRQLGALQDGLKHFEAGHMDAAALSEQARSYTDLLGALPPQFQEVLLQLLDRLESSALFDEESCSFSRKDLVDSLRLWLKKADAKLSATA